MQNYHGIKPVFIVRSMKEIFINASTELKIWGFFSYCLFEFLMMSINAAQIARLIPT